MAGAKQDAGRYQSLGCMDRVYLEESLRAGGALTEALEDDLGDLQKALGLGVREAEDIRSEIVSRAYKCASLYMQTASRLACTAWHAGVLTRASHISANRAGS